MSASIQRTELIRGPGAVMAGNVVLHDADGIEANIVVETTPVETSMYGEIDQFITSRHGEVALRPTGEISAEILAALYPHQSPVIGDSIFGAIDSPLIVHSKKGTKVTFSNHALIQPPQLRLSATQTLFGSQARYRALLGLDMAPADPSALVDIAAETYDAAIYPFVQPNVYAAPYIGTYGAGVDAVEIATASGWTVDVQIATSPVSTDHEGEIDHDLSGVTVTASCQPQNLTEAQLAAMIPYASAQGASSRSGMDLVISAGVGKPQVTLYEARLLQGPLRYGTLTLRLGEIAFFAQRKIVGNLPADLYKVEIPAA